MMGTLRMKHGPDYSIEEGVARGGFVATLPAPI